MVVGVSTAMFVGLVLLCFNSQGENGSGVEESGPVTLIPPLMLCSLSTAFKASSLAGKGNMH